MGLIVLAYIIIFLVLFIAIISSFTPKGMEKRLTNLGNAVTRANANITRKNEDILKETANRNANINKDAIRTTAHAVKEGFTKEDSIYCKHCGSMVENDSKFCKHCGGQI